VPYKEKIAWLSLIAMAVTFGPYFLWVRLASHPAPSLPDLHQLSRFAITVSTQALILGIGHLYLRAKASDEVRLPPDERDRVIMHRSRTFAYYALLAGMCLVGVVMPFNSGGWTIINAALFMIIVAEVVHYGTVVVSYRRQA
jgi:hypothetical protein